MLEGLFQTRTWVFPRGAIKNTPITAIQTWPTSTAYSTLELEPGSTAQSKTLRNVEALAGLTNLTSLTLAFHRNLRGLDGLAGLTKLTSLDLAFCEAIEDLDGLAGLTSLTHLHINGCTSLRGLDGRLATLPHLER